MKIVRIKTQQVEGGWLVQAEDEGGGSLLSEWFHPLLEEAVSRAKFQVREKLYNQTVLFREG